MNPLLIGPVSALLAFAYFTLTVLLAKFVQFRFSSRTSRASTPYPTRSPQHG